MDIIIKAFSALTTDELYAVLQLRSEVFVVEQNCIYQDIDSKDQFATHLLGFEGDTLIGYLRIFKKGDYFENVSIGRVIVKANYRSRNYGHVLLKSALDYIESEWDENEVKVSAQTYLKSFYESHGFRQQGEEYLEDDIPHIAMFKK